MTGLTIGVVGADPVGADLAYAFASALARAGGRLVLHEARPKFMQQGRDQIEGHIAKAAAKRKLSEKAAKRLRDSLVVTADDEQLAPCRFVVVSRVFSPTLLTRLERLVVESCLIGFARANVSRKTIALAAVRPERCFLTLPIDPVWRSAPMEVVLSDNAECNQALLHILDTLGRVPVAVGDAPCLVLDDLRATYASEATRIVEQGLATATQVDHIANDLFADGGPFLAMERSGNTATIVRHLERLRAAHDNPWFSPPAPMLELTDSWFSDEAAGDSDGSPQRAGGIAVRLQAALLGRALSLIDNGICSASDVDWLSRSGLGIRPGLIALAHQLGCAALLARCESYAAANPGYQIPPSVINGELPHVFRDLTLNLDDEGIAVVTVRRPRVLNALRAGTINELKQCFAELDRDDRVRGVVLTSSRGALAGADITELAELSTPAETAARARDGQALNLQIEGMKKPVVAALNGPVLGGGAELAMGCWARVAGPRLLVGQPEVNLGLIPGYGGTQRLPRLIPFDKAWSMLRTGAPIDAQTACELGWASGPVTDDPVAGARALIRLHLAGSEELAPLDHSALELPADLPSVDIGYHSTEIDRILAEVICGGLTRPLAEGLEIEAQGFGRCRSTEDMQIGLKNFIENGPRVRAEFLHR